MLTGRQLHNKPLIGMTDGKKLGEIKDLYLDSALKRVTAVSLGKEGLLRRKPQVIDRALIQVLGVDVWLVAGPDSIVDLESLADGDSMVAVSELKGHEIQSEGGTKLAAIEDVILDPNGTVLGFTLGKLYVQGPLAERKVITRAAITDVSNKDNPLMTTLARAEESLLPDIPTVSAMPVKQG